MAKVTPPRKKDRIFNDFRRPKLLRKRIPLAETAAAAAVGAALVLAALWVASRGDAYDPAERDLDTALLVTDTAPRDLYNEPLRRWREPGTAEASAAADLGPLPASLLAGGWTAGRVQRYTPDTLYQKIDGQAEQYLKFGFRELVVVPLEHPSDGVSLDVFLYDQGPFTNALGLYAEQRGDKPVEAAGPVRFTRTAVGAHGFVGGTVFHVVGTAEGDAVRGKTDEVLAALAGLGTTGATPPAYRALADGLAVPFERVGYTPANAFQLGFASDFWFGALPGQGTARAFVHEDAAPDTASALASRIGEALGAELEPVEASLPFALSRHRYLQTWYALGTKGRFVIGAEDVADRAALEDVMTRLVAALPDDATPSAAASASSAPPDLPPPAGEPAPQPAPRPAGGEEYE